MGESVGKYPTPARIVLSVRSPSKTGHSHRSRRKTATRTQRKSEHSGVVRSPGAACDYSPEPSGKYSPPDWKLCFTVGFGSGTAYRRRGEVPGLEGEGTRSEATRAASAFWTHGRISSSTASDRTASVAVAQEAHSGGRSGSIPEPAATFRAVPQCGTNGRWRGGRILKVRYEILLETTLRPAVGDLRRASRATWHRRSAWCTRPRRYCRSTWHCRPTWSTRSAWTARSALRKPHRSHRKGQLSRRDAAS